MLYFYRGARKAYNRAIVRGIKYLIKEQLKSNLTIALKQIQKAASKAAPKKPIVKFTKSFLLTIRTTSLGQATYTTSKNSNTTLISFKLTLISAYSKAILSSTIPASTLLYLQFSSKTITTLFILTFRGNNNNGNRK